MAADNDFDDFDDSEACLEIGAKVLEMIDRLKVAHAVAPGTVASLRLCDDGCWYELVIRVDPTEAADPA